MPRSWVWPQQRLPLPLGDHMTSPDLPNVPDGYDLSIYDPLSVTELVVLQLLSYGKMDKEIAEEIHISIHTVYSRTASIYSKMGLDESGKNRGGANRARAVADALRMGLIR